MLKAPWAGWNHNCLMPAGSSWTCWKEEVWNISMVHEAGNWKRIPTSCFQMKQETGSGFQLPASKMIGMEARPWASTNLNPERRGGLSLLKRSSCQDPRQNRVKRPHGSCGSNLGNVSSRPLPAPMGRCPNVRLPRWEDRLSLSPRRGPSSATREGDWFPTSHSRTLEQTCAMVVLWFVGRNTRVLPSYGTEKSGELRHYCEGKDKASL